MSDVIYSTTSRTRNSGSLEAATAAAFTLIELLVVIAIIALLISILLPSISKAREQGRAAVCKVNLRQITLAYRMYADENLGHVMPFSYSTTGAPNMTFDWNFATNGSSGAAQSVDLTKGMLSSYLGEVVGNSLGTITALSGTHKISICPSRPLGTLVASIQGGTSPNYVYGPESGYAINASSQTDPTSTIALSSVTQPADTLIFLDGQVARTDGQAGATIGLFANISRLSAGIANFRGVHNKLGNIGWLDGHVTAEPPYLNPSMPSFSRVLPLTIGYPTALPPNIPWSMFQGSFTNNGPANANYYFWFDKEQHS